MPRRGNSPQVLADRRGHRAHVALAIEQLAERVSDMDHADLVPGQSRRIQCAVDHLARQVRDVLALTGEVAGEVALVTRQHPDIGGCHLAPWASVGSPEWFGESDRICYNSQSNS